MGPIYSKTPVLTITGGLFLSNYANLGGGVATSGTSVSKFNNVKILGNEANASSLSRGGFLYLGDGAEDSEFVNCIIVGNKSAYRHGVYSPNGETRFLHCSILGNHAEQEGGVVLLFGGDSVVLENSIMWNNNASDGNDIWVNLGTASANYCLFDPSRSIGEISGASNINQDPLFYDAFGDDELLGTLDDDLRLLQNSPALDMGDANVADLPLTGLSGITRDAKPDLGAYEFLKTQVRPMVDQRCFLFMRETHLLQLWKQLMKMDTILFSLWLVVKISLEFSLNLKWVLFISRHHLIMSFRMTPMEIINMRLQLKFQMDIQVCR